MMTDHCSRSCSRLSGIFLFFWTSLIRLCASQIDLDSSAAIAPFSFLTENFLTSAHPCQRFSWIVVSHNSPSVKCTDSFVLTSPTTKCFFFFIFSLFSTPLTTAIVKGLSVNHFYSLTKPQILMLILEFLFYSADPYFVFSLPRSFQSKTLSSGLQCCYFSLPSVMIFAPVPARQIN